MRETRYIAWAIIVALFCIVTSCQEKQPTPQEQAVPGLFQGTVKLLTGYSDSLTKATDSATVYHLMSQLLDKMTRLNFEQPANTDLELSEDENDTIYKLTARMIKLRDDRLKILSKDSLKRDSVETVSRGNVNTQL